MGVIFTVFPRVSTMANYNSGGNTSTPPPVKACNYCHNSHVACNGYPPCTLPARHFLLKLSY